MAASTADGVRSREPCIHCPFLCLILRMELWEFFFFLMYLNCCLSVFTGQRAEGAAASGCSEPDEPDPGVSATVLLSCFDVFVFLSPFCPQEQRLI